MKINRIKKTRHQASGKLKGRELNLEITALTNAGDGIGHLDQQVVFVPYTMPGDEVRIKVLQDKGAFLIAELLEVVSPGSDRIAPSCDYFGRCGGCDWQHIPYDMQLNVKTEQLRETLLRIGGLADVEIQEIIASPKQTHYRNRIQGQLRNGAFHFMGKGSNKLIAINKCTIADAQINERLAQGFEGSPTGKSEISISDTQVTVVPINNKNSTELGFRQVNTEMGATLSDLVLDAVRASDCDLVHDLYCGRGEWTNEIARLMPEATVLGIDAMKDNIALAQANASQAGLQNVQYIEARVEDALDKVKVKNSFCIVDPPRAGLDAAVCKALSKRPAKDLIYVSCHAAALARDLKLLTNGGYKVISVQPLDMFPQTSHLECLVRLQASKSTK